MRLRHRLAIAFAVLTTAVLFASRYATLFAFRTWQEAEIDDSLRSRGRVEGSEAAIAGRAEREQEYAALELNDPVEQLVTNGALYRADGSLVASTPEFSRAPTLASLGWRRGARVRPRGVDFSFMGVQLRGMLRDVHGPNDERLIFLVATSRRDMDEDARNVFRLGLWVIAAASLLSLVLGWWIGRRLTTGLEAIRESANRVTEGDFDVRISERELRDFDTRTLARSLAQMVVRLTSLIDSERRFASHAAHELRSPLAALQGGLELALRRPRSAEQYVAALEEALQDTERLIDLAEDLLVVARGHGAAESSADSVSVLRVVEDAVAASTARLNVHVPIEIIADESLFVVGHHHQLARMVRNLIDNAISHAPADTAVVIRGAREPGDGGGQRWVTIVVEDQGQGVPESHRERIFEPFFRGESDRARSGAGLGLGIAREIARRHGGDVWLDVQSPYTRFVARLPATAPPAPPLD